MALQTIANINVDFHDNRYIIVNAKQYDSSSRWVAITCYNEGELFNLSASKHSAYIKFRKADGKSVLTFCKINYKGEVLVELTEQMLAVGGICYVDLIVINKGNALVNIDTGEIVAIDDTPILSTMAFCVNVYETTVDNSEIESEYDFSAFNDLFERAEAEYQEVVQLARSYAIGNAGGIRDGENTDNSKYYYEQALASANAADESEANALASEQNAKTSETNASTSESNAYTYMTNAAASESNAKTSEQNADISEANALDSANLAKSYAVGGTGTRENEDLDNAQYYCEVVKSVVDGLNSGFIPIGTILFSELANAQKATGFTYNISDDFVTDDTFVEGAGKSYTAGTNVYYTASGLWDCFGGTASATATVDEVKSYLGIE